MSTKQFGPPPADVHQPTPQIAPGDVLADRYVVGEPIGGGGMGIIHAAHDRVLDRKVAVKVLQEEVSRLDGFVARFEREARAASRFSHPNAVVVLDFGRSDKGLYQVLEWVEGRSLASIVKEEGPLSAERATAIVLQVCEGLAAAHAAGVVHRDIKPENVMVTRTASGAELAKVIDFGIAFLSSPDAAKLTQAGLSIGSPMFMSPEQVTGAECDARADVYSTAAMLYLVLTGKPPYEGTAGAVLRAHVASPPPSAGAVRPELARFDPVIARGMAKEREQRFASMQEMASALRAAVTTAPAPAPQQVLEPAQRPRAPRWVWVAAAVAASLALGVGALMFAGGGGFPGSRRHADIAAMIEAGRPGDALREIGARAGAVPDAELEFLRGLALADDGDEEKARAVLTDAIRLDGSLRRDGRLHARATRWLERRDPDVTAFWREQIGRDGLAALRRATSAASPDIRWNAVSLREVLKDSEPIDLVALHSQDLEEARDCATIRNSAGRLAGLGDARAIPALERARDRLTVIDRICVGTAVDDALETLEVKTGRRKVSRESAHATAQSLAHSKGYEVVDSEIDRKGATFVVELEIRSGEQSGVLHVRIDGVTGEASVIKEELE